MLYINKLQIEVVQARKATSAAAKFARKLERSGEDTVSVSDVLTALRSTVAFDATDSNVKVPVQVPRQARQAS